MRHLEDKKNSPRRDVAFNFFLSTGGWGIFFKRSLIAKFFIVSNGDVIYQRYLLYKKK
jgi:hypothetical protein